MPIEAAKKCKLSGTWVENRDPEGEAMKGDYTCPGCGRSLLITNTRPGFVQIMAHHADKPKYG